MPHSTMQSPLAETLARAATLDEFLGAEVGPLEEGWFRADALSDPNSPLLEEGLTRIVARYPNAPRRVAGAFFIGEYARYLAAAAITAYLAEQRVPDLAHDNIALRYRTFTWEYQGQTGESECIDVRFLSERFAVLLTDPAADHPDAIVLPHAVALRAWLRVRLETQLAPLIAAITARTRLGQRAQWNLAADACTALFLQVGQYLGMAEQSCAEGLAFIKAANSPLRNNGTDYLTLESQGHHQTFRLRGGCCLYYQIVPGDNCATCVLRSPEDRTQCLRELINPTATP